MKKLFLVIVTVFIILPSLQAQSNVNSYKYVIVPLQYKFLKGQNKYRLNTLTKQLFLKSGYEVYYDNQLLPDDVFQDRCLAMYVDVNEVEKGFRVTNLEIELRDCRGELILKSELGQSGTNVHSDRYQSALRNAYGTINDKLFYQENSRAYNSEEEVIETKEDEILKESTAVVEAIKPLQTQESTTESFNPNSEPVVETKAVPVEEQPEEVLSTIFYAQKIEGGFQLVDSEPKVLMVLLQSSLEDVFMVKGENAVVFKRDGDWVLSKNNGKKVEEETLNIKF